MLRTELQSRDHGIMNETNAIESAREASKAAEQVMLPRGTDEDRPKKCFLFTGLPPGKRFLSKQRLNLTPTNTQKFATKFTATCLSIPLPSSQARSLQATTCYRNDTKVSIYRYQWGHRPGNELWEDDLDGESGETDEGKINDL